MLLSIPDDFVEDDLPSLVLWHPTELRQLLPRRCADEQLRLSSRCDMDDCIGMCRVRSDELVILFWVDECSVA
jgi:hypothetical protein